MFIKSAKLSVNGKFYKNGYQDYHFLLFFFTPEHDAAKSNIIPKINKFLFIFCQSLILMLASKSVNLLCSKVKRFKRQSTIFAIRNHCNFTNI